VEFPKPEHIGQLAGRLADAMPRSPEVLALVGAVAGVTVIFTIDLAAPAEVRLHGLYVFPLAIVARYCAPLRWSIGVVLLTTALQFIAFSAQVVAVPSVISDIGVPFVTSVLTVFLARAWRTSYLTAVSQAAMDSLTGLGNRRTFFAELDAEISRQRRQAGSFSLAVLDLDGFKDLNDSKGHRAGDEALKLVADILRTCTRTSDSLGRIGGDEFGILIRNTDLECTTMLRDLCATIARASAAAGYAVTTSIGCKTFPSPPESVADALQQADGIMYEAKLRGKNRAEHAVRDSRVA
jgi:diguanylate cyclase (GGDEF)-like protein